jgi:hypothetical protein
MIVEVAGRAGRQAGVIDHFNGGARKPARWNRIIHRYMAEEML